MAASVKRGSVWWVELPTDYSTRVEGGPRPCVVISSDEYSRTSTTVVVCPLTTHLDSFILHPKVFINKIGQVLCNQPMTIDKSQLQDYKGYLTEVEMSAVNAALTKCLGLSE